MRLSAFFRKHFFKLFVLMAMACVFVPERYVDIGFYSDFAIRAVSPDTNSIARKYLLSEKNGEILSFYGADLLRNARKLEERNDGTSLEVFEPGRMLDDGCPPGCYSVAPTPSPTCSDGGTNCDPIILGIEGQVFKFDGRGGTWYGNLAVPDSSVHWNTYFHKFPDCPADEDTFIAGAGISIKGEEITVEVEDKDSFFPGCRKGERACLGDGSLSLVINGEKIRTPGEYPLQNGGKVIAHNTYSACSRKWYDFDSKPTGRSLRTSEQPQDHAMYLLQNKKGNLIAPKECAEWVQDRITYNDLFDQQGGWATIHIVTPYISMHMEYRQTRQVCFSHNLDSWISQVSPVLLEHQWKGILGETRYPKYFSNGKQVMSDRNLLLDGKFDSDYEVEGPFGKQFIALHLDAFDKLSEIPSESFLIAMNERRLAGCLEGRALQTGSENPNCICPPSGSPSENPSWNPSASPEPSEAPTYSPAPSESPSEDPSSSPTTPYPSSFPSVSPTLCSEPYEGWKETIPPVTLEVGFGIDNPEGKDCDDAAGVNVINCWVCDLLKTVGPFPGSGIGFSASVGTSLDEEVTDECIYNTSASVKGGGAAAFCGYSIKGELEVKDAFEQQGCLNCTVPPQFECSLDDAKGKAIQTIIDDYDGCYTKENSTKGEVTLGVTADLPEIQLVKKLKKFVKDKGYEDVFKIAGSGSIKGAFSGEGSRKIEDGEKCPEEEGTCTEADNKALTLGYNPTVGLSGSVVFFGFGLGVSVEGSVQYQATVLYGTGPTCVEVSFGAKIVLKVTGTVKISFDAYFFEVSHSFTGVIVQVMIKIPTVTYNTCSGFSVAPWDYEFKIFPKDYQIEYGLENNRRDRHLQTNSTIDLNTTETLNITNADLEGFNMTFDDILWNDYNWTCAELNFECGNFTDYYGLKDCGTCGTVGEECLGTEAGGTVCANRTEWGAIPNITEFPGGINTSLWANTSEWL